MGYHDVSLIQSRIDVARASRKARQMSRLDMPEPWQPVVLSSIGRLARQGVVVERATVEYGQLRIIMSTQDPVAREIEAEAARACARACATCGEPADSYSNYMPACYLHESSSGRAFAALYVRGAFPTLSEAWIWWRTPQAELAGWQPCKIATQEGGDDRVRELLRAIRVARNSDVRFLVLVRCRQVGPDRVGRALSRDHATLEAIRASHAAQPSELLAEALHAADMYLQADAVGLFGAFLARQG